MGQRELEQEEVPALEAELRALHERIAGRFRRPEARRRVLAYLKGLLGSLERKNGGQLAKYAGDATSDGVQRLLATYRWDADRVRDDLREYVVEHLGGEQAVLVVDELGFLKQGKKSVGVQRQYSKTAGKVENCQIGIFLAYVSNRGQTLLDRELYLSDDWLWDLKRMDEAGVPQEIRNLTHRDKHELAQAMIGRALAAGVPFAWVAGDAVSCNDRSLRRWLEQAGIAHVLAVESYETLLTDGTRGLERVAARQLAQQISHADWQRLSAGEGGKQGPRLYDWARVSPLPRTPLEERDWLLVRRSITDRADLTYYACFSPTEVSLAELVRVAGHGWISEDALQEARQEVGLDQYEVRQWTSWYRHITLALLAHAFLAVTRYSATVGDAKGVSISKVGTVEKVGPIAVVSSESGSETGYQPAWPAETP